MEYRYLSSSVLLDIDKPVEETVADLCQILRDARCRPVIWLIWYLRGLDAFEMCQCDC